MSPHVTRSARLLLGRESKMENMQPCVKRRARAAATIALLAAVTAGLVAQERDRTKIPDRYKWNLADIYPTEAAWRGARDAFVAALPQLRQFKATLTSSPSALADALER